MWLGGTLKKSSNTKNTLNIFCSSLTVKVGYLCGQSLPEWASMFVSVLERQRAILNFVTLVRFLNPNLTNPI